jgi:hypothetical protein
MGQSPSGFGSRIAALVAAKSHFLTNNGIWESFLQIKYLTNGFGVGLGS